MTSAVILAGGKSTRFGSDKAFAKFGDSTLVESVFVSLKEMFSETIIVTNRPESYVSFPTRVVKDAVQGYGALGGLYTGILEARTERIFVIACDMPYVDKDFIRYMLSITEGDVVVPQKDDGLYEPLHAVYTKKCIPFIEKQMQNNDCKIQHFFDFVKTVFIRPETIKKFNTSMGMFFNINKESDLLKKRPDEKSIMFIERKSGKEGNSNK